MALTFIASAVNAAATFRFTSARAAGFRHVAVFQYRRPDAGATISLDVSGLGAQGTGFSTASENITTTGTDELVVGYLKKYSGTAPPLTRLIGESSALNFVDSDRPYQGMLLGKINTSVQTNIHLDTTWSDNIE